MPAAASATRRRWRRPLDPTAASLSAVQRAKDLHDRVEPAGEGVVLDHERRRKDQDVAIAAAATDEPPLLPPRPPGPRCGLGLGLPEASIWHGSRPPEKAPA